MDNNKGSPMHMQKTNEQVLAALVLAEQALSTLPPGTASLKTANALLACTQAIAAAKAATA